MNKSEDINELAAALAKAQAIIRPAAKDSANPFFKSKYSSLSSVWEACRDALTSNGLSVIQLTEPSPAQEIIVETILTHSSGQWISGKTAVPVSKADAQGYGSAITYARRYGLSALVGICPDDDDGNAAAAAANKAIAKPTKQKAEALPAGDPENGFWKRIKPQFKELSERIKNCPDTVKDAVRPDYTEAMALISEGIENIKVTQLYSKIESAIENDTLTKEVIDIELKISTVMKSKGLKEEDWQAELDPFRAACKAGDNAKAIGFGLAALSVLDGT